ncbi:MAG: MBL fold metallo-hydrolase [Sphaerochaetaceae bacterium]|nr:MBL fold metallo-hydrolase [Spirochaetales bacterium]MDY5500790.1 MBL fold metallo-hydrolase [Sphaerochaetaceae bacterium]
MQVRQLVVGPYQTNCYLLAQEEKGRCWIIDPGNNAPFLIDAVGGTHLKLEAILLTHAHWDHIAALGGVHEAFPSAPIYVGGKDKAFLGPKALGRFEQTGADQAFLGCYRDELAKLPEPTHLLQGGEQLFDGDIQAIATGGHTPGGMSYSVPSDHLLFCGDTLFAGSVGRTDMYGGNYEELMRSIQRLRELPGTTIVLPGHGPTTTLAREAAENPYF